MNVEIGAEAAQFPRKGIYKRCSVGSEKGGEEAYVATVSAFFSCVGIQGRALEIFLLS